MLKNLGKKIMCKEMGISGEIWKLIKETQVEI